MNTYFPGCKDVVAKTSDKKEWWEHKWMIDSYSSSQYKFQSYAAECKKLCNSMAQENVYAFYSGLCPKKLEKSSSRF